MPQIMEALSTVTAQNIEGFQFEHNDFTAFKSSVDSVQVISIDRFNPKAVFT